MGGGYLVRSVEGLVPLLMLDRKVLIHLKYSLKSKSLPVSEESCEVLLRGLVSAKAGERGRRRPLALEDGTGDGLERMCWL